MNRQASSLHPPSPGQSLPDFPTEVVDEDATLFRAHDATDPNPWFFSSSEEGRFNLSEPRGTCYAAEDVETAVRERLGDVAILSQSIEADLAETMAVTEIVISEGLEVAAVNHKEAVRFGLTREIGTSPDYSVTRQWARLFDALDLDGIHYASRFTTELTPNSWAIFGESGAAPSRPYIAHSRVSGVEACERAGLRILPSVLDDDTATVVQPPG